jgi:hypothetical protein
MVDLPEYEHVEKKSISKILGLNQSLILVGPVSDFGIEVRVGENHPRIWIIKNYIGNSHDNYWVSNFCRRFRSDGN